MQISHAIVRPPPENFSQGITSSGLGKPDYNLALKQHQEYCEALKNSGVNLTVLKQDPEFPDSCFVEDTAVVNERCAVITRPGDKRRRGEEIKIKQVLSSYRKLESIQKPGTVDGGDVLRIHNTYFIGLSQRTNQEGAQQLKEKLMKYSYGSEFIPVRDMLHLKSGVNYLDRDVVVIRKELSSLRFFTSFRKITVSPQEAYAANCIFVNGTVLMPSNFPETLRKIKSQGFEVIELQMSEFEKMDGGVSCLSIRF
ncbi:MAG: N(G),N(G)-dimethylarginine dimethylaminohydrolase [Candidatus Aminicenantes bacterium]|nr:N(G),N(G)-dimethylarginine dimethylaminohydrolase [Candidatus Aminicenantes bacterium]